MAKKYFGKIITLAAIAGATTAAVSYFLKYKSFNKDLEEEFHDFEDDFEDFHDEKTEAAERNYVSLSTERPADKEAGEAAGAKTAPEDICSEMIEDAEEAVAAEEEAAEEAAEEDTTTIVEDTTE